MSRRPLAPFARRLEDAQRVHARGDAVAAARLFGDLNRERPDVPEVLHALGVALAQSGRFDEGETFLLRAISREPRAARFRFDLAALYDAQGRLAEAERSFRELVAIAPAHAEAWAAIGMYRNDVGDRDAAGEAYERAYRATPENLEYARLAADGLPPERGAAILAECLEKNPEEISLLMPLAEVFVRADRLEEAETILNLLKARQPESGLVRRILGGVYARQRRFPAAAMSFYEAIQRDPADRDAWTLLADVRDALGDPDGAAAAIGRALDLQPDDLDLVGHRARLLQQAARTDLGVSTLAELPERLRATAEVRLLAGMLLPPIARSNEEIDASRERWMEAMADVEARPTRIAEPWRTIALSGYHLGYQGREDRVPMEALARATLAASPHLDYEARELAGSGEPRLRVGFLSANMRRHSVGRVLNGVMGALDRKRFDVVLFGIPDKRDGGQELGEANADRTVRLETRLDAARASVEAERLDVLVFSDLHLTPFVDALSYSRLAPVQATTWGHPGTGGRRSVDDWISCEDWEPAGNERLYTERLVRLAHAPYVYTRPEVPAVLRSRESFGLRADAHLYGSLQSIFKFHPDMDAIFASILQGDPKGRIVLIAGPHYTYERQLRARFARSFDPDRVDFIPKVSHDEYLAAVAACDVMLDPVHFGGANTSLEAFAIGKPVVTLRGDQMRNRATGGFYRQMGFETLVAQSPADYADLALRLVHDRRFHREAKETILARNSALYDDLAPVAGFEEWLLSVRR